MTWWISMAIEINKQIRGKWWPMRLKKVRREQRVCSLVIKVGLKRSVAW